MLIGYKPPALNSVALTNATFLTADAGAYLTDGKPARISRIQTSGTPSITVTYASVFTPRVIALLGLKGALAAGDIITATTGGGVALGGNSASQPVVQLPDGSLAAWIITNGAISTSYIKITLNRTGNLDIGEVVAMPGVDVGLREGWTIQRVDPTSMIRTRGQQMVGSTRRSYRQFSGELTPAAVQDVRGGGLTGGKDWETIAAAMAGGARCAVIPQYHDITTKAIDYTMAQRTAVYGVATELPGPANVQRQYHSAALVVEEVPPI